MTCTAARVGLAMLVSLGFDSAGGAEWRAALAAEVRYFPAQPAVAKQHEENASAYLRAEFFHDFDQARQRFAMTSLLRADQGDSERSHADLGELYWRYSFAAWDLYVGVRTVFWGVTEVLHLVDIINQTDLVENPDTEDKLGQPMVQLSLIRDWGTWDIFFMPYFRERTFPGPQGRLRTPLPVDSAGARYEAASGSRHRDFAVRYSHALGPLEVGFAHFAGTGREPILLPTPGTASTQGRLTPFYEQIDQTSLDLSAVTGDWLWKLEALSRRGQTGRFTALTGGFEYTLVGLGASALDLGLIAEYQYDGRGAPRAAFQNDLALGARLVFNDVQGSQLLLVGTVDQHTSGRAISAEASRRLGNSWRLSLEGRWFSAGQPDDALFVLRQDDYLQLELTRFF